MNVDIISMHNIPKLKIAHMPFNRSMVKKNEKKKKRYDTSIPGNIHYSAIKSNEPFTHATTWNNLQRITLAERKPNPKVNILCDSISVTFMK